MKGCMPRSLLPAASRTSKDISSNLFCRYENKKISVSKRQRTRNLYTFLSSVSLSAYCLLLRMRLLALEKHKKAV